MFSSSAANEAGGCFPFFECKFIFIGVFLQAIQNMLFPIGSLVSLIACVEVVTALYSSGSNLALRDLDSRDRITTLGAIAISSVEQKRGLSNLKPAFECDHHYADRKSPIFYMIEEFGRWNGSNVSLRER